MTELVVVLAIGIFVGVFAGMTLVIWLAPHALLDPPSGDTYPGV